MTAHSPDLGVTWLRWVPAGGAALVLSLGAVVCVGWFIGSASIVQLHPSWVPMQFNTALGFLALGTSATGLLLGRKRLLIGGAVLAGGIGALTLVEYGLDINLGIDELLMKHPITVKTSHPGRMAPNTATCFVLSSVALFTAGSERTPAAVSPLVTAVTGALAMTALLGYLLSIETAYGWGRLTAMAMHTALGFLLFASSLSARAILLRGASTLPTWLPVPIALGVVAASVALWAALHTAQQRQLASATSAALATVSAAIEAEMGQRISALRAIAQRSARVGRVTEVTWRMDARDYRAAVSGSLVVEQVDDRGIVRWIEPLEGNEKAVGLDLGFEPVRAAAMAASKAQRKPIVSRAVKLVQGGLGVLIFVPMTANGRHMGHTVGVARVPELLNAALHRIGAPRLALSMEEGDQTLWRHGIATDDDELPSIAVRLAIPGPGWRLLGQPGPELVAAHTSVLPTFTLGGGILVAGLMALVSWLAGRAQRRSIAMQRLSEQREEAEKTALSRAEQLTDVNAQLMRSNKDLDQFAYIVSHDLQAPMRGVHNIVGWLEEDLGDGLPEQSQRHLGKLRNRVERMEQMLEDLLKYSRAGRGELDTATVDVHALVQELLEHMALPATVAVDVQGDLPQAAGGRAQLLHVLQNLLSNAHKHGGEQVRITVEGELEGSMARYSIGDNGPGIEARFHERIFEVFQTLKRRDEVEGSGVGLAIVRRMVRRAGGEITVQSAPGAGATFTFTWPAARRAETRG